MPRIEGETFLNIVAAEHSNIRKQEKNVLQVIMKLDQLENMNFYIILCDNELNITVNSYRLI